MTHPGGLFGVDAPDIEGGLHELVGGDRALRGEAVGESLCRGACTVESTLAGDDDPLGHIS